VKKIHQKKKKKKKNRMYVGENRFLKCKKKEWGAGVGELRVVEYELEILCDFVSIGSVYWAVVSSSCVAYTERKCEKRVG